MGNRIPRTYATVTENETTLLLNSDAIPLSSENQHNSYILEKFYSLSSAVARSILRSSQIGSLQTNIRGHGTDYTFRMSQEEWVIMQKQSSVLLMGRSGTGKTTCAVMRMWSRHRAYHSIAAEPLLLEAPESKSEQATTTHLHNLFVTVNSNLCHHIRKYYQGLEATYHNMNNTSYESKKFQLPASFKSVPEEMWPLIITYSQFLQMVDSTFKNPFFATRESQTQGTGNTYRFRAVI
jgi:Cdc6-like AAA superfamily ATPase